MKAEINSDGFIMISAETPIEEFALKEIIKKWKTQEDINKSIFIKSEIAK